MDKKEEQQKTKEDRILDLKNSPSVIAYLESIQGIISRMAGNSAGVKAFTAVVFTIFATMTLTNSQLKAYWWFGIIVSIICAVMDAYYLGFERSYRQRYNDTVKQINHENLDIKDIYNLNPKTTSLKHEVFSRTAESLISFSVMGFYLLFILLTVLLKFA